MLSIWNHKSVGFSGLEIIETNCTSSIFMLYYLLLELVMTRIITPVMFYTNFLNRGPYSVKSPIDEL